MRIKLISPAWKEDQGGRALFPPLNLAQVAALTPEGVEVSLCDEAVEPVDVHEPVDLVGLTAMTATAPRAYAIAKKYREKGIPVVMGGFHATFCTQEALEHVDAVVQGEAEGIWPQVVADAAAGRLKKVYRSSERPSLQNLPWPRRDLYKRGAYYFANTLQTSRGCPHGCSFCSVSTFFGRTYRFRPVEDVVTEIQSLPPGPIGFVDDNIVGSPPYARDLFQALQPLKRKWVGQSSIDLGRRQDLLNMSTKSGCFGLFIGFETLAEENLNAMAKTINRVKEYGELIRSIHRAGIAIEGAFIFGFDEDDPGVFQRTVDFALKHRLAAAQFGILTPLPGTELRQQWLQEKKRLLGDWSMYTISRVVHEPLKMSPEILQNGYYWAWRTFYSWPSILKRFNPLRRRVSWFWLLNMTFRRGIRHMPFPRITLNP